VKIAEAFCSTIGHEGRLGTYWTLTPRGLPDTGWRCCECWTGEPDPEPALARVVRLDHYRKRESTRRETAALT
jgi:hypothetical protein